MQTDVYSAVTFIQIVVLCVLGIVLLSFRIRSEDKTFNLRLARGLLALSYFMLALPAIIEYFFDGGFNLMWVEIFTPPGSAIQSMFFAITFLTILQPAFITRKQILLHLAVVFGAIILYLVTAFNVQNYKWVIHIGVAAYFCLLFIYTRYFIKKYQVSLRRLEEYYDEDEQGRLKWVKISFFAALSLGIIASGSAYFPFRIYVCFVVTYILFYSWFAIRFINFLARSDFYIAATAYDPEHLIAEMPVESDPVKKQKLENSLKQWVLDEGYKKGDISTEEVARLLGTDLPFFRNYFNNHMPCDFRTWRNEMRIKKAQELIADHPESSLNQIAQEVGFITKSNFYLYFKKTTGQSPADYRNQIVAKK